MWSLGRRPGSHVARRGFKPRSLWLCSQCPSHCPAPRLTRAFPPLQTHRELAWAAHAQCRGHGALHRRPEAVSAPGRGVGAAPRGGAPFPTVSEIPLSVEWHCPPREGHGLPRPSLHSPTFDLSLDRGARGLRGLTLWLGFQGRT